MRIKNRNITNRRSFDSPWPGRARDLPQPAITSQTGMGGFAVRRWLFADFLARLTAHALLLRKNRLAVAWFGLRFPTAADSAFGHFRRDKQFYSIGLSRIDAGGAQIAAVAQMLLDFAAAALFHLPALRLPQTKRRSFYPLSTPEYFARYAHNYMIYQ